MRTWIEIVKPYPELVRGRRYKVRVKEISKVTRHKALSINLEFLDAPQAGRQLTVSLTLPIRETGMTADFFKACGLAVTPSSRIAPCEVIGVVVQTCLQRDPRSNEWQPTSFQPTVEDHNHGNSESQH